MKIRFSTESGRPGFQIFPSSDDDEAILKQVYDWSGQFPEDKFGIKGSSWTDGRCLSMSVGYLKPIDPKDLKKDEPNTDNNGPERKN